MVDLGFACKSNDLLMNMVGSVVGGDRYGAQL